MTSSNFTRALHAVPPTAPTVLPVPDAAGPSTAQTDVELIEALRQENLGLRAALESRATIEQDKGMVMLCYGLSADQAFPVLARWSSLWNIKLRVVAAALVRVSMRAPLHGAGSVLARELTSAVQRSPRRRP